MSVEQLHQTAPVVIRKKGYTPAADLDLFSLSEIISQSWVKNPQITLLWMTPEAFAESTRMFGAILSQKLSTGGGRSATTSDLAQLDTLINRSTTNLKAYLRDKYGNPAYAAYLPQFGIVKVGSAYMFPVDRNSRNESLRLTIEAIPVHGLSSMKYGLDFWTDIKQRYDTALQKAIATDSIVSGLVKTKNQYRAEVISTLNALIHVIKGNYPADYKHVLREWGFQKEKF
jgi:hypothetical protein